MQLHTPIHGNMRSFFRMIRANRRAVCLFILVTFAAVSLIIQEVPTFIDGVYHIASNEKRDLYLVIRGDLTKPDPRIASVPQRLVACSYTDHHGFTDTREDGGRNVTVSARTQRNNNNNNEEIDTETVLYSGNIADSKRVEKTLPSTKINSKLIGETYPIPSTKVIDKEVKTLSTAKVTNTQIKVILPSTEVTNKGVEKTLPTLKVTNKEVEKTLPTSKVPVINKEVEKTTTLPTTKVTKKQVQNTITLHAAKVTVKQVEKILEPKKITVKDAEKTLSSTKVTDKQDEKTLPSTKAPDKRVVKTLLSTPSTKTTGVTLTTKTLPTIRKNNDCTSNMAPPARPTDTQTWQRVADRDMLVFSAFLDDRERTPLIRMIGVANASNIEVVYCQVWPDNATVPLVVQATFVALPEIHNHVYGGYFIVCNVSGTSRPVAVSVTAERCDASPANVLLVHHQVSQRKRGEFGVCVPAFIKNFNDVAALLEFVEMHRILGADKITMYNSSIHGDVDAILRRLQNDGIVEVIQWKISTKETGDVGVTTRHGTPVDVHYAAQLACIQDCLYRNMHAYEFVAFLDLDETITPHKHRTWRQMLRYLEENRASSNGTSGGGGGSDGKSYAAYSFANFFFTSWRRCSASVAGVSGLRKLSASELRSCLKRTYNTVRDRAPIAPPRRMKNIVRPHLINELGIHHVARYVTASPSATNIKHAALRVPQDIGVLYHHRWARNGVSNDNVTDAAFSEYAEELVTRVMQRLNDV
ncbi:PREDICTED: uncharacterized protein LOC106810079 [Priapulus caudatus]|uniref:Uncharacterized protein LOC106810079 n=1 Tax=Priapulus caudatus TaxID=37621 RepID=A0ABM1E9G7_PRICU|nr:PREDICTED: uncharacterized protein LOC106810079 [Priapulus caudatus]